MAENKQQEIQYTDFSNLRDDAKEVIRKAFAKSSKGVATMDFSKLKAISSRFSKEQLEQSLSDNEEESKDTLVEFSYYAYKRFGEYKQLIHRFAGVHRFRYYVEPIYSFSNKESDISKSSDAVSEYINKIKPTETMANICRKSLLNGVTYVYFNEIENQQCIQFLPSEYCRTRTFDSYGNRVVEMDMRYFDEEFTDQEQRELIFKQLPKEFKKLYNSFVGGKSNIGDDQNPHWQQLDTEYSCAFQFGEDELPYFCAMFPDLLDFMEYKNMAKLDSELDLFGLLVQKMTFNDEGSLDVDDETFDGLQRDLAKIAKVGGLGAFTTPYDVFALKLKDKETNKQDYVSQGLSNLYNSASLSESTFNSNGKNAGALGITSSNQMLSGIFDGIVSQFINWYTKKINTISGGTVWRFNVLDITCFNEKEKVGFYKDQLATANGSWFVAMSAMGIPQFTAYNMIKFENELGLKDELKPLVTSYTSSANSDDTGRPESDTKSDETIAKIDKGQDVNRATRENG